MTKEFTEADARALLARATQRHIPTRELPYSAKPNILVVGRSETHLEEIRRALELDARYVTPDRPITGHRFDKVIFFRWTISSRIEEERMDRFVREDLVCKLRPGGKLYVL